MSPKIKNSKEGSRVIASLDNIANSMQSERKSWWERDLPKLAKLVRITRFEPKAERDYDDTLYDWESKAKGSGMRSEILKQLMVHLASEKVFHVLEGIEIPEATWTELKDFVARRLFPYSRYRVELEKQITLIDRSRPLEEALLTLAKQRKRFDLLCIRWGKGNALTDDRMKEALLSKLPALRVTACIATEKYNEMIFDQFGYYCKMIIASVQVGEQAMGVTLKESRKHPVSVKTIDVAQANGAQQHSPSSVPKRTAPLDYECYNYDEKGHYMRNCPHPKVRCTSCNRTGHRAESCIKLQHAGPMGRTRTGFLRMTRGGIHLNLLDEATKRALFESMRLHLEGQEKSHDIAKEKAKEKRAAKKAQKLLQDAVEELTVESRKNFNTAIFCFKCSNNAYFRHGCIKQLRIKHRLWKWRYLCSRRSNSS